MPNSLRPGHKGRYHAGGGLAGHASEPAVLPGADLVAACVANADRLDRARLHQHPRPERMYPELPWKEWEAAAWRWATGE
jgi:hypothetical protein